MTFDAPHLDYAGLSPVISLTAGICVVLMSAVVGPLRRTAPGLTMVVLAGGHCGSTTWRLRSR
jgi:hypothetical protein